MVQSKFSHSVSNIFRCYMKYLNFGFRFHNICKFARISNHFFTRGNKISCDSFDSTSYSVNWSFAVAWCKKIPVDFDIECFFNPWNAIGNEAILELGIWTIWPYVENFGITLEQGDNTFSRKISRFLWVREIIGNYNSFLTLSILPRSGCKHGDLCFFPMCRLNLIRKIILQNREVWFPFFRFFLMFKLYFWLFLFDVIVVFAFWVFGATAFIIPTIFSR